MSPSSPFHILSLPGDAIDLIILYVGPGSYRFVAGTCRGFRYFYARQYPGCKVTSSESIVGSEKTAEMFISESTKRTSPRVSCAGRVALWAVRHGRVNVLKWVHCQPGVCLTDHFVEEASKFGRFDCFLFLIELMEFDFSSHDTQEVHLGHAVRNGHLGFVRRFHNEKGLDMTRMKFLCNIAARTGHLKILQFLHRVAKCPWNRYTCDYAARNGHIDCLQYAHENGCDWSLQDDWTHISCAAAEGGITCLKYVHERGCDLVPWAWLRAAQEGHWDCLVYLHENGSATDNMDHVKTALAHALTAGHFDCFKYLLEIDNVEWNDTDFDSALRESARLGHIDCLDYLLELDRTRRSSTIHEAMGLAASRGQLDCLVHLLKVNVVWDWTEISLLSEALKMAVACDSVDCLLVLLQEIDNTEWQEDGRNLELALQLATRNGSLNCLSYLLELNTYTWSSSSLHLAVRTATYNDQQECLVHLLQGGHASNLDREELSRIVQSCQTSSCTEILRSFLSR